MITVTDFFAEWCGPCKAMMPIIDDLASKYNTADSKIKIEKVNIDKEPEKADKFGVKAIPTIIIMNGDTEIRRIIGLQTKAKLEEIINSL